MSQLNRDLLREVFCEIAKARERGTFKHIEKFMMSGKEPFQLVIDMCKKADNVVISKDGIFAKLPHVKYPPSFLSYYEEHSSKLPTEMALFKPISIALASSLTSLKLRNVSPPFSGSTRNFSSTLIPMLKAVDQVINDVYILDEDKQLKHIFEACGNISYVQNGVTIVNGCLKYNLFGAMKFFAIPCHKLTIKGAHLNDFNKTMVFDNPYLRNIHHLTIKGYFDKNPKFLDNVKRFVTFLSRNFPNLETFTAEFATAEYSNSNWDWNDNRMANLFKALPSGVNDSISFAIEMYDFFEVDQNEYPDVQRNGSDYYKIFPITDSFSLKLVATFNADD